MAAEIIRGRGEVGGRNGRFNEAAANGRGNPDGGDVVDAGVVGASMRPRRMAAEIAPRLGEGAEVGRASMRPRRMAAEIAPALGGGRRRRAASMRPRRMAAEIASPARGARPGRPGLQ